MKKRTAIAVAVGCVITSPAIASASVISYDQLASGQNNTLLSVDGVSVNAQALGGNFVNKTVAGHQAVGVAGGPAGGEIDGNQSLLFTFDDPTHVTSLTVAFLYTDGNFGDVGNEIAMFSTDVGSFSLEAAGAESGIWTGFGDLANVSPAVNGHGGIWTISGADIFGGPVTSLELLSGNAGSHGKFGDFSFQSMSLSAVPGPGAVVLLVGAIAFGGSQRR